jgi:hypothetical protein
MMDGRQKEEIHRIRIGWRNLSGTYILCTKDPITTSYPNPSNKFTLSTAIITVKPTVYNFSKQFTLSTMLSIINGVR